MSARISWKKAIAVISAAAVSGLVFGRVMPKNLISATAEEAAAPADLIKEYIGAYQAGTDLYTESLKVVDHLNTENDYNAALNSVYDGLSSVQYSIVNDSDTVKEYKLYNSDNVHIANLRSVQQSDGTWATATIFNEQKDYNIEVPTGLSITINGLDAGAHQTKTAVPADNYSGLSDTSSAPLVDVYEADGMISEPTVEVSGKSGYTTIKDVTSNTIYVGEDAASDTDLANTLISDAKICAGWPAQDNGIGAVAAISITDSDFYQRVSGVQNQWFTAHGTPAYSNEAVLKIVKQSDDSLIANVIFDYYASNGDVDRTWHCGYQMTMLNVGGTWKIAGFGVDSTLNPNQKTY